MTESIYFDPVLVSEFSDLLFEVYQSVRPKPSDFEHRRHLFQMFNAMAKDVFGSYDGFPVIQTLGSFTMNLFTERSDLDLTINFSNDNRWSFTRNKVYVLKKLARALYAQQRKGCVSGVLPLLRARIPVLKVVDCESGIGCDITVGNKDGVSKSLIIKIVSSIDGRFQMLCYLMKGWAKAQDINSSHHHTLNSLSIVSLVALHLQKRDPPILPPFSTLLRDGTDISSIQKIVFEFRQFSVRNGESVSVLFYSLLRELALHESSWEQGLCASAFEGSWIYKTWKSGPCMDIEDFLDRSENCARAVSKEGRQKIYRCIWASLYHLTRFMEGQIKASELKNKLFRSILLNIPNHCPVHAQRKARKLRYPFQRRAADMHESIVTKKARLYEGYRS